MWQYCLHKIIQCSHWFHASGAKGFPESNHAQRYRKTHPRPFDSKTAQLAECRTHHRHLYAQIQSGHYRLSLSCSPWRTGLCPRGTQISGKNMLLFLLCAAQCQPVSECIPRIYYWWPYFFVQPQTRIWMYWPCMPASEAIHTDRARYWWFQTV